MTYCEGQGQQVTQPPRTIFVAVSTELLSNLAQWSNPLRVKIEKQPNDTYEMVFKEAALPEGEPEHRTVGLRAEPRHSRHSPSGSVKESGKHG